MKSNKVLWKKPHRCKDCVYYPDHCLYWDKEFREKDPKAGWIRPDTEHNCPDFERR